VCLHAAVPDVPGVFLHTAAKADHGVSLHAAVPAKADHSVSLHAAVPDEPSTDWADQGGEPAHANARPPGVGKSQATRKEPEHHGPCPLASLTGVCNTM
jgi:hypothetical protein